ncbi:neuropeptides capa receptor isoform X2 [Megachile rotundata]|uniref:neuropeptides capa receptor isoform X2 n=1 Tax=Megachile rotundata TaxID=143995 RepID=UPI003FD4CDB3
MNTGIRTMNISDDCMLLVNNSDCTILSESEYVSSVRGPKYLSWKLIVPVTLVYMIIFVTGVIGNVATCIVIVKNSSMHNSINCYLFNLAVSDLMFLILGLPHELGEYWEQYPWKWGLVMCKLRAYVSEICSYVSVLTIVGFAIERYMAVCHPFRQNSEDLKRSMRFILVAWMIASFSALPIAVYINLDFVEYPPKSNRYSSESAICVMKTNDIPNFPLYGLSCFCFFLLPMAFIAVFYTRICLRIQTESFVLNVEGFVHGENKHAQLRKTIRILSAVVVTFFICWAPFHVQRIMTAYNIGTPDIDRWLYPLTGCLYYFSATINPILYNLISAKYRDAFKETCCYSSRKHISRSAISSMRHSSMVSATGTRIESQVSPMRHVESKLLKNNLHTAV